MDFPPYVLIIWRKVHWFPYLFFGSSKFKAVAVIAVPGIPLSRAEIKYGYWLRASGVKLKPSPTANATATISLSLSESFSLIKISDVYKRQYIILQIIRLSLLQIQMPK